MEIQSDVVREWIEKHNHIDVADIIGQLGIDDLHNSVEKLAESPLGTDYIRRSLQQHTDLSEQDINSIIRKIDDV